MKKYLKPAVILTVVESTTMIAASLPIISGGSQSGGDALGKENNWDIFGDETDDELE